MECSIKMVDNENPTSADVCHQNGWQAGDVLEGREHWGPIDWGETRIQITAIGEEDILAKVIATRDSANLRWKTERGSRESLWTLQHRNWKKVKP